MARYILIAAVAGAPLNGCYTAYPRGTTVADSAANAVPADSYWGRPGDLIWPGLTNSPNRASMRPLDAAASAVMGLPITTLAEVAATCFAGGGAGQ